MVRIKLDYPPALPHKPIPFSKGLNRLPRRCHGWLALTCLLMGIFYIVFGFYVRLTQAPAPFRPLVVSPRQVASWLEDNRPLLLLELWEDDQATEPLLKGALRLKPLSALGQAQREEEINRFISYLPLPRPWLICYSMGQETEKEVSLFIELLTKRGEENVYALGNTPAQWEKYGLFYTVPDQENAD
ncbi:MAG: hypothetical protein LBJ14_04820 [Desulfarculales bacterium]|jgi:hypothetical protein|nr:hypothetical protein [Desulfarculales bacterium]